MAVHVGTDYFLEIARNRIDNVFTTHRYGTNLDVGTTEETIWTFGGVRPYLTAQQTLSIVSSDVNDTAAGSGMRQMLLEGLDNSSMEVSEIITMNGTTPVATANQYRWINRMLCIVSGSNGTNVGTINASFSGTVYSSMLASAGRNEESAYTVPAGKNAYITDFYISTGSGKDAQVSAYFIAPDGNRFRADSVYLFQRALFTSFPNAPRLPSGVTLEFRAKLLSGSAATVSASFDLIVITE